MAKLFTNQYSNKTKCSPVALHPPEISQFEKRAPPVACTSSMGLPRGPGPLPSPPQRSSGIWPKLPGAPCPPSGLQDLSDPASVPRDSLAPLKREAADLHRMARGFPWQPDLGTCLLPGLESLIVLSLIRVLKIESSPLCPPLYF